MASALVVVPLGRLHMRGIQRWVASLQRLNPHFRQSEGHHRLHKSTTSLAGCRYADTGCSDGSRPKQKGGHDRCLPVGLGRYMRTTNGEWMNLTAEQCENLWLNVENGLADQLQQVESTARQQLEDIRAELEKDQQVDTML
ncbi:hypothetical protein XENOCAPTIV_011935 [Xenoophorus captivus]|uniref:Uncharacterized protein n=1 Tax=Xenoophorus captivus TaxID=1517983 RepID=A0ABV0RH36_9TELE